MTTTKRFYGRGKLLISGEYFVLDGAKAFAVPTKAGQWLRYRELNEMNGILIWIATNNDRSVWRQMSFDLSDFRCLEGPDNVSMSLSNLLYCARKLNPNFLTPEKGIVVETELEFPRDWGFGSSSTLVFNVAHWANINEFELLKLSFGGSGYDVACAGANCPITYTKKSDIINIEPIEFHPEYIENLFFAYSGNKQKSSDGIKLYKKAIQDDTSAIEFVSALTTNLLNAKKLEDFNIVIKEHEKFISDKLKLDKVKQKYFNDFWGEVKSLGAWGGDFLLFTNNRTKEELSEYLKNKGILQVFTWNEIVYDNPNMEVVFDLN